MFEQILKTISRKEWLLVGAISVILMAVTIFPVLFAYRMAPAGTHYDGLNIIGEGDYSVYFSYINQVKAGRILMLDYFTSEPQSGGILNIFWLGVGLWAKIFNLSAPIAFHFSRMVVIPVFCAIFYIFSSYIFSDKKLRQWSLIFAGLASGLGGYFALLVKGGLMQGFNWLDFVSPIDLWVTEANVFFSMYLNPHFVMSIALMILFFLLLLLAWENNNYKYSLLAGLTGLIWFNFHPYYAPYVLAITAVYLIYLLARYKKLNPLFHFLIYFIISSVSIAYHFWLIITDYVIGTRAEQNITIMPPWIYVLLGFGFLLLFSILGIYFLAQKFKRLPDKFIFLLIWLVVGFNLLYVPLSFNRRFLEGLEIPMVFLSVLAWVGMIKFFKSHWGLFGRILANKFTVSILFAILFCFSTFFILARDIHFIARQRSTFYLSNEYLQAINWLEKNNAGQAILANQANGHYLPGLINQPVFYGHGHETADFIAKRKMADDFYGNKYNQAQAWEFLTSHNIGYILYSYWEKGTMAINLYDQPYLEKVFINNQIAIYKVSREAGSASGLPRPGFGQDEQSGRK